MDALTTAEDVFGHDDGGHLRDSAPEVKPMLLTNNIIVFYSGFDEVHTCIYRCELEMCSSSFN
jgi:hypothetical protein